MENNLNSLVQKIQQKSKNQQTQIEELITNELTNLQTNLKAKSLTVLNTIEKDMQDHSESISNSLHKLQKSNRKALLLLTMKTWGISFLIILGIFLGAMSTSFLWNLWTEKQIQSSLSHLKTLKEEIQQNEKTLQNLISQTWGIQLLETQENGVTSKFIVLPQKQTLASGWIIENKQAYKIVSQ